MDEQHNSSRKKLDTAIVRLTAVEDSNGFQEDSSKKWKILVITVLTRSWILGKDSGDSGSQIVPESQNLHGIFVASHTALIISEEGCNCCMMLLVVACYLI